MNPKTKRKLLAMATAFWVSGLTSGLAADRMAPTNNAPLHLTLTLAIDEALKANPSLRAAGHQANAAKARGASTYDALVDSVRIRTRPILMTAIGGMLLSTFLTMVYVPIFYSLFEDAELAVKGWVPNKSPVLPAAPETPAAG